jgi:RNA polymerase sigma-70 factor (ECF subfamily)
LEWSGACGGFRIVDTASSQPGDLVLPLTPAQSSDSDAAGAEENLLPGLPSGVVEELWAKSEAAACGLTLEEFCGGLASVGARLNFGLAAGNHADGAQKAAFFGGLLLQELALAQACALGREVAWERFVERYRTALTRAAIAIAGSATVGHDLANSLYAELYGLKEREGERRSPLASYSGRGSLLGWLRTTLAQRHVDWHRRTRRETPLDDLDAAEVASVAAPLASELRPLVEAIGRTLQALPAEDRFLLAAYFLDRQTLLQMGRLLRVHEATVSRRLKRLVGDLRKQLLRQLEAGGLDRRAAEESLGVDPRDLEINLRALLQTSQTGAFSDRTRPDNKTMDTEDR